MILYLSMQNFNQSPSISQNGTGGIVVAPLGWWPATWWTWCRQCWSTAVASNCWPTAIASICSYWPTAIASNCWPTAIVSSCWPLSPLNGTEWVNIVLFNPGFLELHDFSNLLLLTTNKKRLGHKNSRAHSTQLIKAVATSIKIFIVACRQENRSNELVWAESQAKYQQLSFFLASKIGSGVILVGLQATSCVVIICLDAITDTVEVIHQLCCWIIWNSG